VLCPVLRQSSLSTLSSISFLFVLTRPPPRSTLFSYTTLFRSGPQLPGVGGVGAEALQALLELELLGEPRRLRPMRHLGRAFGELGEQLRILRVAEQPDALTARFGELTQLPQGCEVVGLVRGSDAHPCHGQHLGHGYTDPSGNASSVPLTSARNRSASAPSTTR